MSGSNASGGRPQGFQISSWSIRNPIPTVLFFILVSIAGLMGFNSIRVNNWPDIDFPIVVVTVVRQGSAPSELQNQVTRIVEDSVSGISGVRHTQSIVNEGASTTLITFQLGTDLEKATNDVRNAVSTVRGNLPSDIQDPIVQRVENASGQALLTYVVRADNMTPEQLSWYVDNDISKIVHGVKGVANVTRDGGVDREIRIELDPASMAAQGVTASNISNQLTLFNVNLPGGRFNTGGTEQTIRTLGTASSVAKLAEMRLSLSSGKSVRLGDIARVTDTWDEPRKLARFNNNEVVGFYVQRTTGASEVAVAGAVRAKLDEVRKANPHIQIEQVAASVDDVKRSFNVSIETLVIGAILAVLVVLIFLRDWRATFVTSMAIPMSLFPTFWVMKLTNQSFNVVTLLALSLTIGILVDDAIVEIENIVRHIRQGKSPYQAAIEAADEIGLAVVATTATLIAVFAPTGFMPGIVGQFFKSFAIGTCVSVFFSLVVARTLTPLMGAYLLRVKPGQVHHHEDKPFWMDFYTGLLAWCLRHRIVVVILSVAFFISSIWLMSVIPSENFPPDDVAMSNMSLQLPPGSTLAETDKVVTRLTTELRKHPEVVSVYATENVETANLTINLTPKADRKLSQTEFETAFSKTFANYPGIRASFGQDGGGPSSGVSYLLVGDNEALMPAAQELQQELAALPQLTNVRSGDNLTRPEIVISLKADQAALSGVSTAEISQAARVATIGDIDQILAKFNDGDRQVPIRVRLNSDSRTDLTTLGTMGVPTKFGTLVPLSSVADIRYGAGPIKINRLDRSRSATISADLNGAPQGDADKAVDNLPIMKKVKAGQIPGVRIAPNPNNEDFAEMGINFVIAILTGIALMYAVLVLLFGAFSQPLTIILALPLSFGGAFLAMIITHHSMSMPAYIGLIMLTGIAAKNSILLVEYAMVEIKRGVPRIEALMDSARKRARPIIMTTIAMGVGMLPVAMGQEAFRVPMAVAVIGGLITSTLLSLLFVPVAYTIIDGAARVIARFFNPFFHAQGKDEYEEPAE